MAPLAGLVWWLTGIPLPQPAHTFVSLLGGAASTAALVAIGLFIDAHPLRQAATNFFVLALTEAKLVAHTALTALLDLSVLPQIGRASGRGRGCLEWWISVVAVSLSKTQDEIVNTTQ